VRSVDPGSAARVAAWANERSRPLHAHVSEQPAENEACLAAHGRTPTGVLEDAGALSERFTAVHFTHVSEEDVRLLGRGACHCCLCPTTERDLADGIGAGRAIADGGARLALGSDSHAVIDQFDDAGELLRAACEHGHASIGWSEAGRIEPGAIADLVTVGMDSVRLAGADAPSALEQVVFAGSAADISHVVVSGREVVDEGRHVGLDVAAELRSSTGALNGALFSHGETNSA
jgi:cytosine/adenosine deaminase-related metal-dependent hydrolase